MTFYDGTLFIHSYLRWLVLVSLVVLLVRSFVGWRAARTWGSRDERLGRFFARTLDVQFLLGLVLYLFLSPFRTALFSDFAHGVKEQNVRFFGMEHPVAMLIGVGVAQVALARARRAGTDALRFRRTFTGLALASAIIVASIPWPGLKHGRPLARGLALAEAQAVEAASCPDEFRTRCAPCHGASGRGDGAAAVALSPKPADFSSAAFAAKSDAELSEVIREGGASRGLSAAMPPNADLTGAELDALLRCIRGFAPVSPARGAR